MVKKKMAKEKVLVMMNERRYVLGKTKVMAMVTRMLLNSSELMEMG